MRDPHSKLYTRLMERVLQGPGKTSAELRRSAADNRALPPDLAAYVAQVHHHAFRITDETVTALQERYDDDQLFEITVAAALGASTRRLERGLNALAVLEETDASDEAK
jgi:hypothetical protein